MPDRAGLVGLLVSFTRELRAAGLAVGSGDAVTFCAAMTLLDPADLADLYWAGRSTLVTRRESIDVYDTVFRRFFLGGDDPLGELLTLKARLTDSEAVLNIPATDPAGEESGEEEAVLGWMASDVDSLKHKSFAAHRFRDSYQQLVVFIGLARSKDHQR